MNNDLFENIPCNICGNTAPETVYPSARAAGTAIDSKEFRSSGDEPLQDPLVRCPACGFLYVSPRIRPDRVMEGYVNAEDETFVSQALSRERTFAKCLAILEKARWKEPGRILDIGTANGSFLKVAKAAGWEVYGCEPNRWMGKWCKTNYQIDIVQGSVFDGRFEDGYFDVITLWDVLEHTPDPASTLAECARIIRPGGLLVVNYPDIGSWVARLMGKKWVFLLSVHYFYYTRTTIAAALEKAGFSVQKIRPHIQYLELDYILFRAAAYIGILARLPRFIFRTLGMGKMQIPYWVGQTLVLANHTGSKK
jgi:SAM-dependent methyltransferase